MLSKLWDGFLGWLLPFEDEIDYDKWHKHLIRHEDWRNALYYLDGIPHIGVGHNLHVPLTDDQVGYLLESDMDNYRTAASRLPYWDRIGTVRRTACADLVYNLGYKGWVEKFPRANAALSAGDYEKAADELEWVDSTRKNINTEYWNRGGRRARIVANWIRSGEF